jgi:hypothetical protein
MTDVTQLGLWPIIAFFIPLLVSLVKQAGFTKQVNATIALVVYVVAGIAYVVITAGPEGYTVDAIIASITTATIVGTAAYNLFWSNLGVSEDGDTSLEARLMMTTSFIK